MDRIELTIRNNAQGRRLTHIRLIRAITRLGLKEAKDCVEDNIDCEAPTHTFYVTYTQLGLLMADILNADSSFGRIISLPGGFDYEKDFNLTHVKHINYVDMICDLTREIPQVKTRP